MTDFERAIKFILEYEGGYVNHPSDPGGETKYGISKRSYPTLNIKTLTLEQAKEIYKKDYWDQASCNELAWPLNLAMLDFAVNSGVSRAKIFLQRCVGAFQDGDIGPKTLKLINNQSPKELAKALTLDRVKYLINTGNTVFYSGWMKRTHNLMYEIGNAVK